MQNKVLCVWGGQFLTNNWVMTMNNFGKGRKNCSRTFWEGT